MESNNPFRNPLAYALAFVDQGVDETMALEMADCAFTNGVFDPDYFFTECKKIEEELDNAFLWAVRYSNVKFKLDRVIELGE